MSDSGQPPPGSWDDAVEVESFDEQNQLDFEIEFFGRVLQRANNYVDVMRCQAELLTRKGLHAEALQLDRRLAQLRPDDCVVSYNLACSLALAGDHDDAVATLRRALETGYDDIEYLSVDSDLDSLRDSPEYQALLREFAQRRTSR